MLKQIKGKHMYTDYEYEQKCLAVKQLRESLTLAFLALQSTHGYATAPNSVITEVAEAMLDADMTLRLTDNHV